MKESFFPPNIFVSVASRKRAVPSSQLEAAATDSGLSSLHDPPLEPRDEAAFLLTAAAEIEHALMVQYLYAAYSVRVRAGANKTALATAKSLLMQIAREEMGHLATVQNLLNLVGGPINLGREHSPYASDIYPFRFRLEPVTLGSLSKYVTAESPLTLPEAMTQADRDLVEQIRNESTSANDGQEVHHVGPIYARLAALFDDPINGLSDTDWRTDTAARQALFEDWGFTPRDSTAGDPLIIRSFPGADVGVLRAQAADAVRKIADQGEGFDIDTDPGATPGESHFERFLSIYKQVAALTGAGVTTTWPVATNPNTTTTPTEPAVDAVEVALEEQADAGRITEPRARAWAQLFNLRYRLLLGQFAHFVRVDQDLYSTTPGPRLGDRTARGLLLIGTFDEMRHLSKIAGKLVQLPKDDAPGALHAGPTFELPYSLNLPDGEPARWRTHLDASRAATRLIAAHLAPDSDPFLTDLLVSDIAAQRRMTALASGVALPPESLPTGFAKAVTILEEAVRGFTVGGPHGRNFWADQKRNAFVSTGVYFLPDVGPTGPTPVARDPGGAVVPDPAAASLIQRLTAPSPAARMPRFRPPVPAPRVSYLKQWITDGCPDDDPPDKAGVHHEQEPKVEPSEPP
jgi:hypothetical protein